MIRQYCRILNWIAVSIQNAVITVDHSKSRVATPVNPLRDLPPLRCSTFENYISKPSAISECFTFNSRYAVPYSYDCKRTAIIECSPAYACYTLWDSYACKRIAVREGGIAYARYAVGDRDCGNRAAANMPFSTGAYYAISYSVLSGLLLFKVYTVMYF